MKLTKLVIIPLFLVFIIFCQSTAQAKSNDTYKSLENFSDVLHILEKNYVEDINAQEIIQGAIKGMLSSLDPHSSYMTANNFEDLQNETKGSFSGIGIEVTMKDGVLAVVSPIEGTPAFRQGIKAGDKIIKIGDTYTKDLGMMDAVNLLRGKKGSNITLSIYRTGWAAMRDFTMKRDVIPLHSVKTTVLDPGYIYLRITNFQARTTRDTLEALINFKKKGAIHGLIMDLRNNPGGLLEQAVNIVDIFQDKGIIVSTRGRRTDQTMEYQAHIGGPRYTFPIIILVNEGSASASEIVAGAMQDNKRALILGVQTFGKGSVQTVYPLSNGAGIRLTTARYYTPNGRSIQAKGITPDFIVPLQQTTTNSHNELPKFIREKDLQHHMKNDTIKEPKHDLTYEEHTRSPSLQTLLDNDNQLSTALMLLQGIHVLHDKLY